MDKIPSLRFKEFSGEWEEKRLGEVSDVRDGTHDSPKYIDSGYPLVTSKNVQNGKIDLKNINYISLEDFEMINKRSKVSKGDILMGMIGTIGNLAIVDRDDFAIKNVALIKEKNVLKNSVLYQILQSNIFYKKLSLLNEGGTQKFISLGNIRNLNFNIPCLKEQEKIGNFLSSVDKKISITEEKLNLFNQYKKGIMQKIFNQELRFKDENGNNYPQWEERKLGDIVELIDGDRGKNYPNENDIKEEGILFLSTSNFFNNKLIFNKNDKFISIEKFNQLTKGKLNKDDLIITLRGSIGNIIVFENKLYNTAFINAQMMIIRPKKDINKYFLYNFFQNSKTQSILQNMSSGSAQPQLTKKDLKNFIVSFPCLEEQKKIADFLSAIDNKIENISGNLESLKLFKKSLLQKMFV